MALHFSTTTDVLFDVVISCDSSLDMTQDEKNEYLKKGGDIKIKEGQTPTYFVIKPMGPKERENAEVRAGAYTRSELGRILWVDEPNDVKEKAYWRENLTDLEKNALSSYEQYINRVYDEMIRESVKEIKGIKGDVVTLIQNIRPESDRVRTVSELIIHIQRLSLLGSEGK